MQVLPPRTNSGASVGNAFYQGFQPNYQEGLEYNRNRSRLQTALGDLKDLGQNPNANQFDLLTGLISATAGQKGSEKYIAPLFDALKNQMLSNRMQGQGGQTEQQPANYQGQQAPQQTRSLNPNGYQNPPQEMASGYEQPPMNPTQQISGGGPIVGPANNIASLIPPDLKSTWDNIYRGNVGILGSEGAAQLANQKTNIVDKDMQNALLAAQSTQNLAQGERDLEQGFSKQAGEFLSQIYGDNIDAMEKNQFDRFSLNYKDLPDAQRIAKTYDEFLPWINEKRAVDNVMTPSFVHRILGRGEEILSQIQSTIKPFTKRGQAEKDYTLRALNENGISLPESYAAVYPASNGLNKAIESAQQFSKGNVTSINPFSAENRSVENLKSAPERAKRALLDANELDKFSNRLKSRLGQDDSLMTVLYGLMRKGWSQPQVSQAIVNAQKQGLKLNPRQQSEFVQLSQDMAPGFWDLLKNFGQY